MMKKYLSIIFITLTIAGSSCKKDYLNLTVNPNTPSQASPNLLLSGALKTTAGIVNGGDYVQYTSWVGYLTQSTSFQVFNNLTKYIITTSDYNGPWQDNYLNISNYNALEQANAGPYYNAIAEIMICYDYQALVDNYNNVPYSQALKGASNLNPAYDNGPTIYLDLAKRLDAAIKLIQSTDASSAVNPLGADIMFGGTMTKWAKFANTLKLRICLRESTKSSLSADYATLKASVQSTESVGYIDNTFSASVNPGYTLNDANGGQESPLWQYYGTSQSGGAEGGRNQYQASSVASNFYAKYNDPRLGEVFSNSTTPHANRAKVTSDGAVNDAVYGTDTVAVVSTPFGGTTPVAGTIDGAVVSPYIAPSLVGTGLLVSAAQSAVIMSSSEALFLQAEGTVDGILTKEGSAQTLYNEGITSSFEFDQVPNADNAAQTYYNQTAILYPSEGTTAAQIAAIITQKWAALAIYGGFEAFNEQRRTGIPTAALSVYPGVNAPRQVTRILYPFIEYQTNAASVGAEGPISVFTSLIFWAQ